MLAHAIVGQVCPATSALWAVASYGEPHSTHAAQNRGCFHRGWTTTSNNGKTAKTEGLFPAETG